MSAIDQLLTVVRTYQEAVPDLEVSTLSWRVFGDTKKLGAIMDGADLHTRRHERALQWFSENWPEGATWPAEVARPSAEAAA